MKISGNLTINHNGQNHTIQADDFTVDEHLDGKSTSFGYDTGTYSVEIIAEDVNGAPSWGDWQREDCTIVQDNTTISL